MHAITQIIQTALTDRGALHPLIVHFPICLLFVSPLFIILGLLRRKHQKHFFLAALILMALGWLSMLLAIATGEQAAEHLSNLPRATVETLEKHYELAEQSRLTFGLLTAAFLGYFCGFNKLQTKLTPKIRLTGLVLFLCIYVSQLIMLTEAAHHGAQMVHEHGVRSTMFQNPYHDHTRH